MGKVKPIEEVLEHIKDGAVIMIGGFLAVGTAENLVDAIVKKGVKNLTIIGNDTSFPDRGIGKLVVNKQVKKVIVSHIGTNPETARQMHAGEMEVELVPQGTLAERIRAAGAGLGGILTPTGIGTIVEEGKKKLDVYGKEYLLELPLKADVALIKAYMADQRGNLVFRCTANNFNQVMSTAAEYVVVETENLVEVGEIDPNDVMIPHVFVDAIVCPENTCVVKRGA